MLRPIPPVKHPLRAGAGAARDEAHGRARTGLGGGGPEVLVHHGQHRVAAGPRLAVHGHLQAARDDALSGGCCPRTRRPALSRRPPSKRTSCRWMDEDRAAAGGRGVTEGEGGRRVSRLTGVRATWQLLRGGDLRARVRATRQGQVALRLHLVGAALETGLLDALAERAATTADLARTTGARDRDLLEAFLRVMAAARLVDQDDGGLWRLRTEGRVVLQDDLVRASYEAFADFHTGLYRELPLLLAGGAARRDIVDKGGVIARVSAAFEPFVEEVLLATVTARRPRRVLDIGCGSGLQLATMLRAAPAAAGVGVEGDDAAAGLADRTLARRGLADRASVVPTDIEQAVSADHPALVEPFDLALMANMIYYVPESERVSLLRLVAGLLAPGGALLVVTTAATPQLVSRHFDLLLRAQEGRMELPDTDALVRHLAEAGFRPGTPQQIAPGSPLIAVSATLPRGAHAP